MKLRKKSRLGVLLAVVLLASGWGSLTAQLPELQWVGLAGGFLTSHIYGMTLDDTGNIYITGSFSGTIRFGETEMVSAGGVDIFVAKMDNEGNWVWTLRAGGVEDCLGMAITIDDAGNIFLIGNFCGTATFGETELVSAGLYDTFVAKVDNDGDWIWVIRAGGTGSDRGRGIVADNDGNIFVTGSFQGTVSFGHDELECIGSSNIYVAKLDSQGNWLWSRKAGGYSTTNAYDIALDLYGNVYITGFFMESAFFGDLTELQSGGERDVFVAKLTTDGNWMWVRGASGDGINLGEGISVDNNGHIFVTGPLQGTATFGEIEIHSVGLYDTFVAKLDELGQWLQITTTESREGYCSGYDIAVDNQGNAYVTGVFRDMVVFGDTVLVSTDRDDVFFGKIDENGNWAWVEHLAGSSQMASRAIAAEEDGTCYVTGMFTLDLVIREELYDAMGYQTNFIAKFIQLYPHPTVCFNPYPANDSVNVQIDLDSLRWEYTDTIYYLTPLGFRVYFNDTGEFEEDDEYEWVPFNEDQVSYLASEILPEQLEHNTRYYWKVVPTTIDGGEDGRRGDAVDCPVWTFRTEAGASIEQTPVKLLTKLRKSYPNPFNPSTIVSYSLAKNTDVELTVYNVRGQIVRKLVREFQPSGHYRIEWDGTDDSGKSMPSGLYFYRLRTDEYQKTGKMMMVK